MAFAYSAHSAVLPPNADDVEKELEGLIGELNVEDVMRNKRFLGDIFKAVETAANTANTAIHTVGSVVCTALGAVGNVGGSLADSRTLYSIVPTSVYYPFGILRPK
jgi:hypothetical protein